MAKKTAEVERINGAGLVHFEGDDLARLESLPIFYYTERARWYSPNGDDGYSRLKDSSASSLIAEYGFSKSDKQSDLVGNRPVDRASLWLMQNNSVAFAGQLAGYPAGVHEVGGERILVTESPRLITPRAGPFPTIRKLLGIFKNEEGETDYHQDDVFLTWASESFKAFWRRMIEDGPWQFRHCPALAMFGPKVSGKSALIDLVLQPLFGGRQADPMKFMRDGNFNKDLFTASLLVLDDKKPSRSLDDRRERGEALKDLLWKPQQRMEGKGLDAIMVQPFFRMVIAGNTEGLHVCPALSESLMDKIIILKAKKSEGLPETHEANEKWVKRIEFELPCFAAFLLAWSPPEGMELDPRTRVANFWHPDITRELREMQPEMRLLELIDSLGLIGADAPLWEGTCTEFERQMKANDPSGLLNNMFHSPTAVGRMLADLSRTSRRVKRTNRGNQSFYRIFHVEQKD